jgi:hypothetical protein
VSFFLSLLQTSLDDIPPTIDLDIDIYQKIIMSLRSFAVLGLAASALAEPKVLHMPMARNPNANPLAKRDSASVTVTNALSEGIYFVNATVGTPGQLVQLVLDTGSSDVWFFGPDSCDAKTADCLGGTCTFFPLHSDRHVVVAWHVNVQVQILSRGSC